MPNLGDMVVRIVGDTSGLDKSLTESEKRVNNTKETVEKLAKGFQNVTVAMGAAVAVAKVLIAAWAESERAQIALDYALKGNISTFKGASERVSQFAVHMARLAGIDDDVVKAQFAVLASFGLTETQMKKTMTAAINLSATGLVTLDEAIIALGGSFEGNIGRIGRYVPALKNLTKEQLEAGGAVEFVNKQFKGTAEVIANTLTGRINALTVAIGDLKEAAGQSLAFIVQPALKPIAEFINSLSGAITQTFALYAAQKAVENGTATLTQRILVINEALADNSSKIEDVAKKQSTMVQSFGEGIMGSKGFKNLQNQLVALQNVRFELQQGLKAAQAQQKAADDAQAKADARAAKAAAQAKAKADAIAYLAGLEKDAAKQEAENARWSEEQRMAAEERVVADRKAAEDYLAGLDRDAREQEVENARWAEEQRLAGEKKVQDEIEKARQEEHDKEIARQQKIQSLAIDTVKSISETVGEELAAGELTWKSFGEAAIHAIGRIVSAIGDELAASAAADVVKAIAATASIIGAWAAPGYWASAAIKGAGAAASWLTGGALSAVKLAEGGIVPARPGGTLIRAGEAGQAEMVLPINRLDEMLSRSGVGGGDEPLTVRIVLERDDHILMDKLFKASRTRQLLIDAGAIVS